jgi:hypothetical protein
MDIKGRRVYPKEGESFLCNMQPGDYGLDGNGLWAVYSPIEGVGPGYIPKHTVIEHPDGTITVSPSILISGGDNYPS